MAKQSGLGCAVTVDDNGGTARTISNDVTSFDIATPRGVQEITGVDKSSIERQLLLADYSVTLNGVANFSSNLSHDVFKTVTSGSVNRTTAVALNGATLTAEVLYPSFGYSRSSSGELTWKAEGSNADGAAPVWS
jgi:hypothetical protein